MQVIAHTTLLRCEDNSRIVHHRVTHPRHVIEVIGVTSWGSTKLLLMMHLTLVHLWFEYVKLLGLGLARFEKRYEQWQIQFTYIL